MGLLWETEVNLRQCTLRDVWEVDGLPKPFGVTATRCETRYSLYGLGAGSGLYRPNTQ